MTVFDRLLGEPLRDAAGRLKRTAESVGLSSHLNLQALPTIAAISVRQGLHVKAIHAIHAAGHPNRIAVVDHQTVLTYKQMDQRINQMAHMFQTAGVAPGQRVVIMMENRADYLVAWFALFRIGVSTVHASYRATAAELAYVVDHCGARLVLGSARTSDAVHEVTDARSHVRAAMVDAPQTNDVDACDLSSFPTSPPRARKGDMTGNVVYTSGTTGTPKGAVRDMNAAGVMEVSRILEGLPLRMADRHMIVCPMYHSGAQVFAMLNSALGATIYIESAFDAATVAQTLRKHRIHSVFLVPTMIRRVLEETDVTPLDFPDLRAVISGAAAFPHALRMRAIERLGRDKLFDFYGATELGWVTLIGAREMKQRPGSVGRALPGLNIHILKDGKPAPVGEVGTIYVETLQLMEGYLDDEDASRESRRGDWATVDDLGWLDKDGYLYLSGRDRDMIISAGVNIYPVEIEEVLNQHPKVVEAAVIGLPDEEYGESVGGVVVGNVDADELDRWCRKTLSNYKVPKRWFFVDSLPRNPTGKILKRSLRERFG